MGWIRIRPLYLTKGRPSSTFSDGTSDTMWWIEKPPYVLFDHGGGVGLIQASTFDTVRFDESSFSWVGAQTFVGPRPYEGHPAQYYQMKSTVASAGGEETLTLRAWIDPQTHLPLALDNGYGLVSFTSRKRSPSR
ncbi:MAG: hypothetical protein WDO13_08060 [Verrucomicrobiota bacterium]